MSKNTRSKRISASPASMIYKYSSHNHPTKNVVRRQTRQVWFLGPPGRQKRIHGVPETMQSSDGNKKVTLHLKTRIKSVGHFGWI